MIINIFTFFIVVLLPGLCILWLINLDWYTKWELQPGGSIWLVVPTSVALSISLISILGWAGFYLHWGFYEVRFAFIGILILLSFASFLKLWQRRQNIITTISCMRNKKISFKSLEFVVLVFIGLVLALAIYGGTWFSHTADSFNHMAAVRSLIKFNNPVPMQIHWDVPVNGMDPTFGTWHLVLAIWVSLTGMDLATMWLLATIILAPIIILTFIVLAVEFTHSKLAALIAGLSYVILHISGDFRVSAQPNRMGQIVFWLVFVYLILAIGSYGRKDNRAGLIYTLFSAWFAWTCSAIHLQYFPALFGIAIPALVISMIFPLKKKHPNESNKTHPKNSSWKTISGATLVVMAAAMLSFAVRSSYTISEKNPILTQQSQTIRTINPFNLIFEDLNTWFSNGDAYIIFATLCSLALINIAINGNLGAKFIVVSSVLVPIYVTFTTLFLGRGGLLFSTFNRLILLTPPFLIIGWAWVIDIAIRIMYVSKNRSGFQKQLMIGVVTLVLGLSLITIYQRMINPGGGLISLYSPTSKYSYPIELSRQMSLLKTRADAIKVINTIPDNEKIIADEGVGYEMIGLTGKNFIILPSQHTPLQEKKLNDKANQEVADLMSGTLDTRQVVDVLLGQDVNFIYIDKERYNGPILWDRLDSLPILDEIGGGENWRVYQVVPDNAEAYVILDEKIRNTNDFLEKIALYRELEKYYSDHERYVRELSRAFPLDSSIVYDFVKEGQNFQVPRNAGDVYNFLINLNAAKVISEEKNSVYRTAYIIKGEARGVIFQHPTSQIIYKVDIPQNSRLDFSIALDPAVWEVGKGDGVEFRITLEQGYQKRRIFNEYIDPKNVTADRRWLNYSLDLSAYSGNNIKMIFETSPGFQNNTRFDWAGWGEPRIRRQVEYDLLENWNELVIQSDSPEMVMKRPLILNGEKRNILFQHPTSTVNANVYVPFNAELQFGIGMDPEAFKYNQSDGMVFNVYIKDQEIGGDKSLVYSQYLDPSDSQFSPSWYDVVLDLSNYGGDQVEIIFETHPGPFGNTNYDWGGWSSPVIVARMNSVNSLGLGK